MKIVDVDTIGAYVVFCYDYDEEGDLYLVDEIWRESFDDCLKEVAFSWLLPFEVCQCVKFPDGLVSYKRVARSFVLAEVYE